MTIPNTKKDKSPAKIFLGCLFTIDCMLHPSVLRNIQRKVLKYGGKYNSTITKKTNFVITQNEPTSEPTSIQTTASKYGIPVVSEDYIDACLEKGELLDSSPYEIIIQHDEPDIGMPQQEMKDAPSYTAEAKFNMTEPVPHDPEEPFSEKKLSSSDDLKSYEIIKFRMLKEPQETKSARKYCTIELLANESLLSTQSGFCVVTHVCNTEDLQPADGKPKKLPTAYFYEKLEDAVLRFEKMYIQYTDQPYNMIDTDSILPGMGSARFQAIQSELATSVQQLDSSITNIVDAIWDEAVEKLNERMGSWQSVPMWKIDQADAVLYQIGAVINKQVESKEGLLQQLGDEFYSTLPHLFERKPINDVESLVQKKEFCQLLRDIVSVKESVGSEMIGAVSKYRSLRCHIERLPSDSPKFTEISDLVYKSQQRKIPLRIHNVFTVHRYVEHIDFAQNIGNKKLLFHASLPKNFLGILSRGLLMPHRVVKEVGAQRKDEGMLGAGIYFADSINTCIKYSFPLRSRKTRLLLVCEVALGRTCVSRHFRPKLTKPPDGYDSVHGVRKTDNTESDFMDDEFVIYDPRQQHLSCLIEFSLPDVDMDVSLPLEETAKTKSLGQQSISSGTVALSVASQLPSSVSEMLMADKQDTPQFIKEAPSMSTQKQKEKKSLTDIYKELEEMHKKEKEADTMSAGFTAKEELSIQLKEVHVRGRLVDLVGEVVLFQLYKNTSDNSIKEAKYVFPLESSATVCAFEAYVNNQRIVGKVKEKQQAHQQYKEAVSKGKKALLMDEEIPDVFTVSIGNIPGNATVIIKITYITELVVDGDAISFSLPSRIASGSKKALNPSEFGTQAKEVHNKAKFDLEASLEMPFEIKRIWSPTHKICYKKTDTMAVVKLAESATHYVEDGFTIYCSVDKIHVSRMWVENHPNEDTQACMLSFYPEFESEVISNPEIILIIDCSNSMAGKSFLDALKIAVLFLRSLPTDCQFNILAFGTVFKESFVSSRHATQENKDKASEFLASLQPDMGNTELFRALRSYQLMQGKSGFRNMIIISDGHVNNEGAIIRGAKKSCSRIRLFPIATMQSPNKHFMQRLALAGGGFFMYMNPKRKSQWARKVNQVMNKATHSGLTNVQIDWQQFDDEVLDSQSDLIQAPQQLSTVFSGSHQIIYGFVSHCYLATLKAMLGDKQFSSVVSTSELLSTKGQTVHRLTARAIIRDWEEGLLSEDWGTDIQKRKALEERVVQLSLKYNIVTTLTSFVAIEDKEDLHITTHDEPLIQHLLKEVNVDILSYIKEMVLPVQEDLVADQALLQQSGTITPKIWPCRSQIQPVPAPAFGFKPPIQPASLTTGSVLFGSTSLPLRKATNIFVSPVAPLYSSQALAAPTTAQGFTFGSSPGFGAAPTASAAFGFSSLSSAIPKHTASPISPLYSSQAPTGFSAAPTALHGFSFGSSPLSSAIPKRRVVLQPKDATCMIRFGSSKFASSGSSPLSSEIPSAGSPLDMSYAATSSGQPQAEASFSTATPSFSAAAAVGTGFSFGGPASQDLVFGQASRMMKCTAKKLQAQEYSDQEEVLEVHQTEIYVPEDEDSEFMALQIGPRKKQKKKKIEELELEELEEPESVEEISKKEESEGVEEDELLDSMVMQCADFSKFSPCSYELYIAKIGSSARSDESHSKSRSRSSMTSDSEEPEKILHSECEVLAEKIDPLIEFIGEFGGGFPFLVTILLPVLEDVTSSMERGILSKKVSKILDDTKEKADSFLVDFYSQLMLWDSDFCIEVVLQVVGIVEGFEKEGLPDHPDQSVPSTNSEVGLAGLDDILDQNGLPSLDESVSSTDSEIRLAELYDILDQNGLPSLGFAISRRIKRAVRLARILIHMIRSCLDGLRFTIPNKIEPTWDSLPAQSKMILLAYLVREIVCSKDKLQSRLKRAVMYLKDTDEKYPLVYSILNVGKSWEDFILKYDKFPNEIDD